MSALRLHIEHLVLHGVAPEEAAGVVAALKTELGRALVSGALPERSHTTPMIRAALPASSKGAALGRAAGRAIATGVCR